MRDSAEENRGNPAVRRFWSPGRGDRTWRLSSTAVSALLHVLLFLLFAVLTVSPGRRLLGWKAAGLGDATIHLSQERESDLDARELLKEVRIEPYEVSERRLPARPLPRLESLGAPVRRDSRMLEQVTARFSMTGNVHELDGEFGNLIGRLRRSGLDVALVVDTSGSMQQVIDELAKNMAEFSARLQGLVPTARIGVVAFRDRDDADYLVRFTDLSFHGRKVAAFLSELRAAGGGDWEEGVLEGFESAIGDLSWRRRSKKVILLVGGSPPHREDMRDILEIVGGFRRRGGMVSAIDITPRLHEEFQRFMHRSLHGVEPSSIPPLPAFYREVQEACAEIVRAGGGEMAGLGWKDRLVDEILVFTFGSRWRADLVARKTSDEGAAPDRDASVKEGQGDS